MGSSADSRYWVCKVCRRQFDWEADASRILIHKCSMRPGTLLKITMNIPDNVLDPKLHVAKVGDIVEVVENLPGFLLVRHYNNPTSPFSVYEGEYASL